MKLKERSLLIVAVLLLAYLIVRLVDQAKLMWIFPLDYTNDYSAHMAMLYFLVKCGFHNLCSYWYNGYVLFLSYTPGWSFFALPFYWLTKNIQVATYFSIVALLIISLFSIFYLGRKLGLSKIERLAFFVFIFANPIAIGNFIRLGRLPELFSWVVFIPLMLLLLYYKDKKLDKSFLWFIPLYATLMVSHPLVIIPSHVVILSFFLVKSNKEKMILVLAGILGALISSFWWLPYLINLQNTTIMNYTFSTDILSLSKTFIWTNIANIIITSAFLASYYFYSKYNKIQKKEKIFYFPLITLAFLFLLRLTPFIPVLKNVYTDVYIIFFLFFTLYTLLKTEYPKKLSNWIFMSLAIFSLFAITFSIVYTPWFPKYDQTTKEVVESLSYVQGRLAIVGRGTTNTYTKAIYSYIPIKHDIKVIGGWSNSEKDPAYINKMNTLNKLVTNCKEFNLLSAELNVEYILSYDLNCDQIKECGWKEISRKEHVCILKK